MSTEVTNRKMENENETRPLLYPFQSETWRSRARKRCVRIPSEITITGIILGLFLIVVTLLIVLENMESDKKQNSNTSLSEHLLASPMKYNKKADNSDDQSWQNAKDYTIFKNKQMEEKGKKWDKVNKEWKQLPNVLASAPLNFNIKENDPLWQAKRDYIMKLKERKMELRNRKWDKIIKGWKLYPNISASPMKFDVQPENQLWQDNKDYMKLKERKMEEKNRKWDKINKGWKKLPDISGSIHNQDSEEIDENLNDEVETEEIVDRLDDYGKEIDDSLEIFPKLSMSDPTAMRQFRDKALEVKNLLHSGINWKIIDDGWKALSEQGFREKDIRRALFMAMREKREEIRLAELQNVLQSPMNVNNLWDQISDSWKKNLYEGNDDVKYPTNKGMDDAKRHLEINEEWRKKDVYQSPVSDMKKFVKEDEGWENLAAQGWKNKAIEEKVIKAWKERENVLQSPINMEDLWVKATDFLRNIVNKGKNNEKSQLKTNDEWASKFSNLLQSSYEKWKENDEKKEKHSKDVSKDKNTGTTDEPSKLQMNFDDFSSIIEAIKDQRKDMNNPKTQMEINDEFANTFGNVLQSTYKKMKKYEELREKHAKEGLKDKNIDEIDNENDEPQQSPMNFDEFFEIIEAIKEHQKERNSIFGRNGGDVTSSPGDVSLQKSMPFVHSKQDFMGKEWHKLPEQSLKEKEIKEAVYDAWKDGDKLRKSAIGQNDMKWKKVNNGWKTISNKSASLRNRCPIAKIQRQLLLGSSMSPPPIDCALIAEKVRREFGRCIDLSFLPKECKPEPNEKCFTTYKYRKMDGSCNNRMHPTWGKSGTPLIRMIEPDYADGVSALRAAKDGKPLPNPRLLSRKLYSKRLKPNADTSVLFMYFGLLIDHDVIETALNPGDIDCCDDFYKFNPMTLPKECLQIDIAKDDPFYGPKNVNCLNLVRSAPVNGECGGRREQLNKATAFLDGSVVYGSTASQAKQLRTFVNGQLRTQLINNTPFMAYADDAGSICGTPNEPLKCFEAGDSRVNMMVELTVMHTLWYREHNRIALQLHELNPDLSDEVIYQEARRILIAEFQHITYNEFLPILLGGKAMQLYELTIDKNRTYKGYDDTVNPSVFNVFGAAAFRFGHSLAPDVQYLVGPKNSTQGKVLLHETFFNENILYHEGFDLLIRGAATQRTQTADTYASLEVREHLFQPSNLDYGYDLSAVGIQRGRDHGLPGYIRWRSICSLSEIKTWDDLYKIMDKERVDMFKEVYASVEDIDLIPGALAEHHDEGSVGPTYTCLIGRQFKKTRKGDRFWFENLYDIGSLTRDQLKEIYKSSMARIVCDNSDNITEIQQNPFKVPSSQNVYFSCDAIPKVDLSKWSLVI